MVFCINTVYIIYIYKVVISLCLFVYSIITQGPLTDLPQMLNSGEPRKCSLLGFEILSQGGPLL